MKKRCCVFGLAWVSLFACVSISSAVGYVGWQNEYDGTGASTRYLWNFNSNEVSGTSLYHKADNVVPTGPDPKAVLYGGCTFSSGGKFEYGANLTGTDGDQLFVGALSLTNSSSLTVEAWVRFNSFNTYQVLADKMRNDNQGFKLQYNKDGVGERLIFFVGDGSAQRFVSGKYSLDTNQWYHLAGTWDESTDTLRVFVNGVEVNSATFAGSSYSDNSARALAVGSREYYKTYSVDGTMDCVRISDVALAFAVPESPTAWRSEYDGAEVNSLYLWNFNSDEISSGKAENQGPSGPDPKVILYGGCSFSSDGKFEGGANLTGTDGDQLWVGTLAPFAADTSLSFETWVRFNSFNTYQVLADKMRNDNQGFKLQYNKDGAGDRLIFFIGDGSAQRFVSGVYSLNTNQWYHLAGTWNAVTDTLKVFVNGAEVNSATFSGSSYSDNASRWLTIGSREYYKTYAVDGTMDCVRISDQTVAFGVPAPPATFAEWVEYHYLVGSDAESGADPDGDGVVNLAEYGLGGDPTNSDEQGFSPTYSVVSEGEAGWINYVFPQRQDDALNCYLELSTNLVSGVWTNIGYVVSGTNAGGYADGFDAVTNRISTEVEAQQFIRLVIEQ